MINTVIFISLIIGSWFIFNYIIEVKDGNDNGKFSEMARIIVLIFLSFISIYIYGKILIDIFFA